MLAETPANQHYSSMPRARIAPRRSPVRVRLGPSKYLQTVTKRLAKRRQVSRSTSSQEAAVLSACGGPDQLARPLLYGSPDDLITRGLISVFVDVAAGIAVMAVAIRSILARRSPRTSV